VRGTSRRLIQTRAGLTEVRVERRAIGRQEDCGAVVSVPASTVIAKARGLADDVSKRLRDRIAFPSEFWKGASE